MSISVSQASLPDDSFSMISRRGFVAAAIVAYVFILAIFFNAERIPQPSLGDWGNLKTPPSSESANSNSLSPHVQTYFDQVFSASSPPPYDFPALREQCERVAWAEDPVYLKCDGMSAGLTSIMSQVKVCLKFAIDAGTGLVLPSMPLRDSVNLKQFNFYNTSAYMDYDKWFDAEHLVEAVGRACPGLRIVHQSDLDRLDGAGLKVKNGWNINIAHAPGFVPFQSYFWVGRTFKSYFDAQYSGLKQLSALSPDLAALDAGPLKDGITVIRIASHFLLFRITDDPTGFDLRLWNDLSLLIRFRPQTRELVARILPLIPRQFYGVHFRVEKDTIWSSLEHQLKVDLDALDRAWEKFGTPGQEKPMVYLACGDQEQVEKFVEAGKGRGWDVTHKWQLAQSQRPSGGSGVEGRDGEGGLLEMIGELPFDFQGAVDMGVMMQSKFFLGIMGSAFSSTIANARDKTGRYRGSSFEREDEGAGNHLFNDLDATHYACCL